jgi:putative ABC transport system substrate-binding protein
MIRANVGRILRRLLVGGVLTALLCGVAVARELALGVVYPEVREPYQDVFREIIAGINSHAARPVQTLVIGSTPDRTNFEQWLAANDVGALIALGRGGVNAAETVAGRLPVVGGALLLTPQSTSASIAGISLDVDPDILFRQLRSMAPGVRRVVVVYDPQTSAWLMDLAGAAARAHGLILAAQPAENLKQSARLYSEILSQADAGTTAIWLPVDPVTIDEKVILPLVLKEAWDRNILVFSSNPAHAKKGALFSFYPDNEALGRRLAQLADRRIREGDAFVPSIMPLRDLRIAVNRRTADHLGISISREQQQKFDLVFPAR